MHPEIVRVRTAEGHHELAMRTRRLSQRHCTVLLRVDGRRSAGEIVALTHRAGVQERVYRELIGIGLIAEPAHADGAGMLLAVPIAGSRARRSWSDPS